MQKLEQFIQEKMTATHLPGLSAAAVVDGEVVWARGFGFRDIASGQAATDHTLYCIASMTKSFTCLAIMQLAEQGKLDVDDPIGQHIPFDLHVRGEPVKIWHLMSHASGIPALAYAENMIRGMTGGTQSWLSIANYQDMVAFMRGTEKENAAGWATDKPGQSWAYLNEGYQLLGYIIEQVSGQPYVDYVTERILQPLGMDRSFFAKAQVDADPDTATPYVISDDGTQNPSVYPYGSLVADGGLISSALDLARYITMHMNGGQLGSAQLLSPQGIAAMHTGRVNYPQQNGPFGQAQYGYGFGTIPDFFGQRVVSHSGSVGTATSYLGFLPESKMGIILLTNGSGYAPSSLGLYGLAEMLGEDPETLLYVVRDRRLTELTGIYETYRGSTRREIRRNGDLLVATSRTKFNDNAATIIPVDLGETVRTFTLLQDGVNTPVTFTVTPSADSSHPQVDLLWERYRLRRVGRKQKRFRDWEIVVSSNPPNPQSLNLQRRTRRHKEAHPCPMFTSTTLTSIMNGWETKRRIC